LIDILLDPTNPISWAFILVILAGAIFVISRPFSTYIKFVYPNAKYEAIGNPYITEKELNKIVESKNIESFKDVLNNSKDYKITGEEIFDIQKSLDNNFIKTIDMIKKDSSKKMNNFFNLYLEKYDYFLIKNTVKDKFRDIKIDTEVIDHVFLKKNKQILTDLIDAEKNKIPDILKLYDFPEELIKNLNQDTINFLKIDILFDKHLIDNFKQIQVPYKCQEGKKKFINYLVDTLNLKNLLRAKQYGYNSEICKDLFLGEGQEIPRWKFNELAEADSVSQSVSNLQGTSFYDSLKNNIEQYNKENSVQILENSLDSNFLCLVRNISLQNYTSIGPTIRFLVSKELEIQNLKVIAKGITENLKPDVVKDLLVMEAAK